MRTADVEQLISAAREARAQTLMLTRDLSAADWRVPLIDIVNPPLWELGHVGWFQERWCLRETPQGQRDSIRADADALYDSSFVEHDSRWSLALPGPAQTRGYLEEVLERSIAGLAQAGPEQIELFRLCLFHEYMHIEAFVYTWQTLQRPGPAIEYLHCVDSAPPIRFEAAEVQLGSEPGSGFVFDNEKWAHPHGLDAFEIDAYPVSNRRFAEFVEAGGYEDARWWHADAYASLRETQRCMPAYWRSGPNGFEQRRFDRWIVLDPAEPVVHVSADEAQAYCRWAGRSLPSEAQWQHAASTPNAQSATFAWGHRVWEWTASEFQPFAGFSPDAYRDYSAPWFGSRRVLKGGAAATPPGMLDARYRNFFVAQRHDVFSGFRTCGSA